MLIDLVTIEFLTIFPGRKKTSSDFSDELIALCSLLDKIRVFPQGATSLQWHEPEELESVLVEDLDFEP